jgi:hypothetical protein
MKKSTALTAIAMVMVTLTLTSCASKEDARLISSPKGGVEFKNKHLAVLGMPSADPISLATAEAIQTDARNRAERQRVENELLSAYIQNPEKYEKQALQEIGVVSDGGSYDIIVYNVSGRPLQIGLTGSKIQLVPDTGRRSFSVAERNFSFYSYETDGQPFKTGELRIPTPIPKIPVPGETKKYAGSLTITNR